MPRIIDAHVHIAPAHLLGSTDARYPVTVEKYGKKRESDGRICQFMPVYMAQSAFPADALLSLMEQSQIEKAVILQSPCLSFNDDVAALVQTHKDRLRGAMIIEPCDESCLDEIRHFFNRGLTIIKFEMSVGLGYSHPNRYPDFKFDSPLCENIWRLAEELGLTITIDTSPIGSSGYQAEAIAKMAQKFSSLRFVLCHLGFPFIGLKANPEKYTRWKEMTAIADLKNVWFDVAALPTIFKDECYPYPSAMELLREFIDAHGPDKPIWGSDIPGTLTDATYPQMIAAFDRCPLFSDIEKDRLFYQNAENAYF